MSTSRHDLESVLGEYKSNYDLYSSFTERIKIILTEILDLSEIEYLSIESRTKSPQSLKQKIELGHISPKSLSDVRDLSGVRVITYVYDDIAKVEQAVRDCFVAREVKVDEKLGTDRVGYRSHHWIISLTDARLVLPEYERFTGLCSELQIRTVLQHAWAQIGHNQVYKPSAVLPAAIERNFSLLSGVLEVADNEFNRISREIAQHQLDVAVKTESGDLDIPIDSISLREYFNKKFGHLTNLEPKFGPKDDMVEEIISELGLMGITTLSDLDAVVSEELIHAESEEEYTNFCGIARSIMIMYDADKYFAEVWQEKWSLSTESETRYRKLGVNLQELLTKYPALAGKAKKTP